MSEIWVKECLTYNLPQLIPVMEDLIDNTGFAQKIRPGVNVLLKPNLLAGRHPDKAVTTHPVFLEALIIVLQKRGAKIKIFDSPGGPFKKWFLKSAYETSGLVDLAKRTGAELNWSIEEITIDNPQGKLCKQLVIAKVVTEADLIINLPKFKTHGLTILTGAAKNMLGCVPGLKKAELHIKYPELDDFSDALVDVALGVPASLTIMDAIVGMEGSGPGSGDPRLLGLVLAGENPFIVDLAMAKIINLKIEDLPMLAAAAKRGLLPDWSQVRIHGRGLEKIKISDWKLPPTAGKLNAVSNIIPRQIRNFAMKRLRPLPYIVKDICRGCGECVRDCPAKCMSMMEGKAEVNLKQCIRCYCCQELCPHRAVELRRTWLGNLLFRL